MLRIAAAPLPPSDGVAPPMPAWLGEGERARWATLPPAARRAFAASRALLRELLAAATGVPPADWDVSARAGERPAARPVRADAFPGGVQVSLSHRLGWVAAAVAMGESPLGIDLECARAPRSAPDERAALMLAPAELPLWQSLPVDEREPALLDRWTAKEAWFKARSTDGAAPWDFRRLAVLPCPPERADVRVWRAGPLHVALCCADAARLAEAACAGLPAPAASLSCRVEPVAAVA